MDDTIQLAGCIIVDDYDRILLLHRNTDSYTHWEMPGGKIEKGETPDAAAAREISEELGVRVALTKSFGGHSFEDNGKTYKYYWFQAKVVGGEPSIMEPETFDDLDYLDIEDLPSLALSSNMLLLQEKLLTGEIVLEA